MKIVTLGEIMLRLSTPGNTRFVQSEMCIRDRFKKVVELKPDLFEGNYYLGVFYTIKGDALNKEMNEKQYINGQI